MILTWDLETRSKSLNRLDSLIGVREKGNNKVFVKSENTSVISLEYVHKWKMLVVVIYFTYLTIL